MFSFYQTGRVSIAEDAARIATSILTRNNSPGPKQTKQVDPKAPVKAPKPVSKSDERAIQIKMLKFIVINFDGNECL